MVGMTALKRSCFCLLLFLLQPPVALCQQSKALVTSYGFLMVITTNIHTDRMAIMKGNTGKYVRCKSMTAQGICGELLPVSSVYGKKSR